MGKPGGNVGSGEDASVSKPDEHEVLIDGLLYNVKGFKHPGGSIIHFLRGKGDATETFEQFHDRSTRAQKVLKSLPSRPCPDDIAARRVSAKKELVADFRKLFKDLKAEGWFKPSMGEVVYRISEVLLIFSLGFYFLLSYPGLVMKALGILLIGISQGRCGWLMHEGGHVSLTGNIKWDHRLQAIIYGTGCGMSAGWWRIQHNKHHATPQKLHHDPDLDTLPLVAFNAALVGKVRNPFLKAWLKMQAILFIPVTCLLVTLGWQLAVHPRYMMRTGKYDEFLAFGVRYLMFGWLMGGYTWPQTILVYLLIGQISGSYIFTNFSLSHTHLEVTQPDEILTWTEYASKHTTNISNHWFVNWWMANLNFQIEHHLFPSMPQFRHPKTSVRVKALFEKHGLRYDYRGYFSCLGDTLGNLSHVGDQAGVTTSKKGQ